MGKNIYVGNMAFGTTEDTLRELFAQHGTVTKVQVVMDRETGRPRGFAFVEMSDGGGALSVNIRVGQDSTVVFGRNVTSTSTVGMSARARRSGSAPM